MKLIRFKDVVPDARPDGRAVRAMFTRAFDKPVDSVIFYHCTVPKGHFDKHYHTESEEIIWFPLGGKITVNGTTYDMAPWDGVHLMPGDVHSYTGNECPDIVHFAVKLPDRNDKVPVKE